MIRIKSIQRTALNFKKYLKILSLSLKIRLLQETETKRIVARKGGEKPWRNPDGFHTVFRVGRAAVGHPLFLGFTPPPT